MYYLNYSKWRNFNLPILEEDEYYEELEEEELS
jgi:hypothetical protein